MSLIKGTALMQAVCQQAFRTFRGLPEQVTKTNLNRLAGLISNVRGKDFHLDESLLKPEEVFVNGRSTSPLSQSAPACFIHVDENPVYSIAIIILRNGGMLPLHDHPGMTGVVKVLRGKLRLRCLTASKGSGSLAAATQQHRTQIHAHVITDAFITEGSEPCILTPTEGNFHQLWSVDGPAAFMDVLSPPYGRAPYIDGPDCHYFKEMVGAAGQSILEEIPCPDEYWCDQADYEGPPLYESAAAAAAQTGSPTLH